MRTRNFLIGAVAALMAMVSCQEENQNLGIPQITLDKDEMTFTAESGEQTVNVTATRSWIVDETAEWIAVTPEAGDASAEPQTVTVTVLPNEGMDREAEVTFTIGMATRTLTVRQAGPGGSATANIVYFNDFDKEKAEKEDDSWKTYLDQFDGWKNATGTGAENCGFSASGISARTNSADGSAGKHSVYEGSGMNYLWFGKKNHFAVTNISLDAAKTNYTLSFGTERYEYGVEDNTFKLEEFKVYISSDAKKWVELKYAFPGALQNGKWDLASTTFTLPANTSVLNVYFTSTTPSVNALDDVKLVSVAEEGTKIDFSTGVDLELSENTGGSAGGEVVGTPSGDGTETSPYNVAGITKKYQDSGVSDDIVYVKGIISEFKGDFPAKYNSADIYISDDGTTAGQFYIFHGKNFGEAEFKAGDLKKGDKVVFKGKIKEYEGSPQLSGGVLVSLNDNNEGGNEGGGETTPSEATDVTVAEFNAAAVSTEVLYRLTGKVSGEINVGNGSFDITDGTGTVYVYKTSNWADYKADVADGGTITVVGQRGEYEGKIEVLEGRIEAYDGSTETPVDPETPIACTKIDKIADLTAGTYYMAGYLVSYTNNGTEYDWSAYPYHVCTGVVTNSSAKTDIATSNYSFADNAILKGVPSSKDAVDVVLEAVTGKANTYYIKIGEDYLYSSENANRKLALGTTKDEWTASDFTDGGILFNNGSVNFGTTNATGNVIRSYTNLQYIKYGVVFFKKN